MTGHDVDPATDFCRRCGKAAFSPTGPGPCITADNVVAISHIRARKRLARLFREAGAGRA